MITQPELKVEIRPSPLQVRSKNATKGRLAFSVIAGVVQLFDFFLVLTAAAASFVIYPVVVIGSSEHFGRYMITGLFAAGMYVAAFQWTGGYRLELLARLRWQVVRVLVIWFTSLSTLLLLAFVAKVSDTYSRGWTITWSISAIALLLAERTVLRIAITRWRNDGRFIKRVAIAGASDLAAGIVSKLQSRGPKQVSVVGVFADHWSPESASSPSTPALGNLDDLSRLVREGLVDEVVIALPLNADRRLHQLLAKLRSLPIDVRLSIDALADACPIRSFDRLLDIPVLDVMERPLKNWNAVAKQFEDKIAAAVLLAVFALPMALIAVLIKLESRGPVLFIQERFGFNNKVILVLKFRTMYLERGDPSGGTRTTRDDPRVTRIGRILRTLSLDELPQLMNVLKGDMSLVGPRPHALSMKAGDRLYHEAVEAYFDRHKVKPGITGWAQVNGLRGEIDSIEKAHQRVAYDLEYIENWSLWFDAKILFVTLGVPFERNNAY